MTTRTVNVVNSPATELASVEVVEGDMLRPQTLAAAFEGCGPVR